MRVRMYVRADVCTNVYINITCPIHSFIHIFILPTFITNPYSSKFYNPSTFCADKGSERKTGNCTRFFFSGLTLLSEWLKGGQQRFLCVKESIKGIFKENIYKIKSKWKKYFIT